MCLLLKSSVVKQFNEGLGSALVIAFFTIPRLVLHYRQVSSSEEKHVPEGEYIYIFNLQLLALAVQ